MPSVAGEISTPNPTDGCLMKLRPYRNKNSTLAAVGAHEYLRGECGYWQANDLTQSIRLSTTAVGQIPRSLLDVRYGIFPPTSKCTRIKSIPTDAGSVDDLMYAESGSVPKRHNGNRVNKTFSCHKFARESACGLGYSLCWYRLLAPGS